MKTMIKTTKVISFEELEKVIDLYQDSEHPINEVLSALKDNLWWKFYEKI